MNNSTKFNFKFNLISLLCFHLKLFYYEKLATLWSKVEQYYYVLIWIIKTAFTHSARLGKLSFLAHFCLTSITVRCSFAVSTMEYKKSRLLPVSLKKHKMNLDSLLYLDAENLIPFTVYFLSKMYKRSLEKNIK